jgi:hypothetical protein
MVILLVLLFVLPLLGHQLGVNLDVLSGVVAASSSAIRDFLIRLTSALG